jgi:hypothetical protein
MRNLSHGTPKFIQACISFTTCFCALTFFRECPEFQPLEIPMGFVLVVTYYLDSRESRVENLKSSKKVVKVEPEIGQKMGFNKSGLRHALNALVKPLLY